MRWTAHQCKSRSTERCVKRISASKRSLGIAEEELANRRSSAVRDDAKCRPSGTSWSRRRERRKSWDRRAGRSWRSQALGKPSLRAVSYGVSRIERKAERVRRNEDSAGRRSRAARTNRRGREPGPFIRVQRCWKASGTSLRMEDELVSASSVKSRPCGGCRNCGAPGPCWFE